MSQFARFGCNSRCDTATSLRDVDTNESSGLSNWKSNKALLGVGLVIAAWVILYLLRPSMVTKKNSNGTDAVDAEGNKIIDQQKFILWSLGIVDAIWALIYTSIFC